MFAEVAVCLPFSKTFFYRTDREPPLAVRVQAPFGHREVEGFVVGVHAEAPPDLAEIRPLTGILDAEPLIRPDVFELCRWIAGYYLAPLGEVMKGALPPGLTARRLARFEAAPPEAASVPRPSRGHALTPHQEAALARITGATGFETVLLHGVTGSGKTEVYIRAVEHCVRAGRTALVLVPEIGLTPQLGERFAERFGPRVAFLHSALTLKQRSEAWLRIRHGRASIVIGTRSALFAPLDRLGLIIVDEEHETSYKQEEMPRYHARDSAVMRAKICGAAAVLGSATPSMESFHNARARRYAYVQLPERVEARPLPRVEIVNMRDEYSREGRQVVFSGRLLEGIGARLERGEQTMVLLNRRGYSMFLLCRRCGFSFECRDCSVSMTYHRSLGRLLCHYCGLTRKPPATCPECESEYVQYVGEGTEQVEALLREQFPAARIGRIDRDTMRRLGDYQRVLGEFREGAVDVLVGTQMIAKGHDFPRVTLVGVLAADAALSLPDFRAAERTFQLLTQVAGRSGRGDTPGEVLIQSYHPDHYTFQLAATQRFEDFYAREAHFRKTMFYPPFTALAGVLILERSRERAIRLARGVSDFLDRIRPPSVRILGPAPAPLEKINRTFRHQLLIKAASREVLRGVLEQLRIHLDESKVPPTRVIMDVDPISLL